MKLGQVTKLDKRNRTKFDDDVMSDNCDVIAIFPIYNQLEQSGSWIPDA